MPFRVGDWISHPQFGNGQVKEVSDPYLHVRFLNHGSKTLLERLITTAGSPPSPSFTFPPEPRASNVRLNPKGKTLRPAMSFSHLLERFIALFPKGFQGSDFDDQERHYKARAAARLHKELNKSIFSALLESKKYDEVSRIAKSIASSTNLIFSQELMKMNRSLKTADNQERFAIALYDILYGADSEEVRFERFTSTLGAIGCATWTIATYFQFLLTMGQSMFMKPAVIQTFAKSVGVALQYEVQPNWLTFTKTQETAERTKDELEKAKLNPRNGMDVQSFMYCTWNDLK